MIYILNNRNIHTHAYAVFIMCTSLSHQSCARILIRHYAFILHSSNILYAHMHTYTASYAYCTIATCMYTHTHAKSNCNVASSCVYMLMQHIIQTLCILAQHTYIHTLLLHMVYILNNRNIHTHTYTVLSCVHHYHINHAHAYSYDIMHSYCIRPTYCRNMHVHTYTRKQHL